MYQRRRGRKFLTAALLAGFLVTALLGSIRLYCNRNDGFSVDRITSNSTHTPRWMINPLSSRQIKNIRCILDQRFTYLNKGAQSYAFVSEDGRYVIKFFKQQHLRRRPWLQGMHLPEPIDHYRRESIARRVGRKEALFSSYQMAYQALKAETGLIYMQLTPQDVLQMELEIVDRNGEFHQLDLDKMEFIVQERAVLVKDCIVNAMYTEQISDAQHIIDLVLDLIDHRTRKGYIDSDPAFLQNYGIASNRAVQFDIGSIEHKPTVRAPKGYQQEFERATVQLSHWLQEEYPILQTYLENRVDHCSRVYSSQCMTSASRK